MDKPQQKTEEHLKEMKSMMITCCKSRKNQRKDYHQEGKDDSKNPNGEAEGKRDEMLNKFSFQIIFNPHLAEPLFHVIS